MLYPGRRQRKAGTNREGDTMTKKRKPGKTDRGDPLGDLMTGEFVLDAFREAAVEECRKLKEAGLDVYFGKDGKVYAEKPDGRIVLVQDPKKING